MEIGRSKKMAQESSLGTSLGGEDQSDLVASSEDTDSEMATGKMKRKGGNQQAQN